MDNDSNRRAHGRSLTDLLQKINQITWAIAAGPSQRWTVASDVRSISVAYADHAVPLSTMHRALHNKKLSNESGRRRELPRRLPVGVALRPDHSEADIRPWACKDCAPLRLEKQRLASAGFRGRNCPDGDT
jgi:hypothetical protein